ncbi:PAS domain S-box-containing protein [Streptacidiphilus sp. MAP12-33]|uniref:SpoIIE family protein phosphatase n=1 Tax=Streptacidiphilus sp. MAP12-33 TaxID=3156266 RepID=UPI0035133D12
MAGQEQPGGSAARGELGDAVMDALFSQSPVGLHVYDRDLRLVRVNTAARLVRELPADRLLGLTLDEILGALDLDDPTAVRQAVGQVLETGIPVRDLRVRVRRRRTPAADLVVSVSVFRLKDADGGPLGLAAALTDVTARVRAEAELRLLNDAASRIGTTLDVFCTAAELCELACPAVADTVSVDVYDAVLRGQAPAADARDRDQTLRRAGFRSAGGRDRQGVPVVGEVHVNPPGTPYRDVLDTLAPRLVRRLRPDAAWLDPARRRDARMIASGVHSMMLVPIRARGVVLGLACFYRWRSPVPFDHRDLRLARQLVALAGQCLDNARLYGRERSAARVLAGGFSSARTSVATAVELARTHLPAGTGGGWFDALPLSGARVSLVAGDTTTGTAAPAAMGELRAAIEALSELDLPPDEILERLHDLAGRPGAAAAGPQVDGGAEAPSATCLHLVYDPITRRCTVASAGHPPPLLVRLDGQVESIEVEAGPPLGQGVPRYPVTECVLPEGSTLVIYNAALLAGTPSGSDALPDRLRSVLAAPFPSLQATCEAVAAALAPKPPTRDAYLLLARTRTLGADRTNAWTLPNSPRSVALARARTTDQLAAWGLDQEVLDDTALVVSELVTNSVRYAEGPIQLRLIRGSTLVCEVTDGSNASPHLRRAVDTDENGRGLFITAQLTQRWGVRPAGRGKTLWAERSLTPKAG